MMKVMHCKHCNGKGMVKEKPWSVPDPPEFEVICKFCGGTGHIISEE